WSKFEKSGSTTKRDAAIAKAAAKLESGWRKAEEKGANAGIDCAAAFLKTSTAGAFVSSATGALVDVVNDGLDLDTKDQAKCGSKILKAAAVKCQGLLGAESAYQKNRSKTGAAEKRAAAIAKVQSKFGAAFAKAKGGG